MSEAAEKPEQRDQWWFWREQLAGNDPTVREIGVPESGYYRMRHRMKGYVPLGVWIDEDTGKYVARVDGVDKEPDAEWCERVFAWCCRSAITYEVYEEVLKGKPWPDQAPEKRLPSNMPEDPAEAIKMELEIEQEIVDRFLRKGITDDNVAGQAAALASRIKEIGDRAEAERVKEKKPLDEKVAAVQRKWTPIRDMALDAQSGMVYRLKRAVNNYAAELEDAWNKAEAERVARINKRNAEIAAEQKRLRDEEAAALQRKADEDAAAWLAANPKATPEEAPKPVIVPPVEPPPPEPEVVKAEAAPRFVATGASGRSMHTQKNKVAVIDDWGLACAHFKDNEKVREAVQKAADQAAKLGAPVPGARFIEQRKVV